MIGEKIQNAIKLVASVSASYHGYQYMRYERRKLVEIASQVANITAESESEYGFAFVGQAAPLRGLVREMFQSLDFYPSIKDVAVATAVTAQMVGKTYDVDDVIDFSQLFIKELKSRIIVCSELNEMFSEYRNVSRLSQEYDRKDIQATLENLPRLFTDYFKRFDDKHFSVKLIIQPRASVQSCPSWQPEESIKINVDPSSLREGFFLPCFDYYKNGEKLTNATRHKGYEYFNGLNINKGIEVVWR